MTTRHLAQVPAAIQRAWSAEGFARDGHATVEVLAQALARAQTRQGEQVLPWRPPADLRAAYPPTFPEEGHGNLVGELSTALAGSIRLHHPHVLGHQVPPPLPAAALAELAGALVNNGMAVYEMGPAATAMEHAVIDWMAGQLGFPTGPGGAGGVLTSGGSVGNLTALLAARQARAGFDAWTTASAGAPPLAVLVSADAHYSVARAVRILGWGDAGAIPVAIDAHHRLDVRALDDAVAAAAARGIRVIGVVAAAGSTATGAFDPLEEIAAVARARKLWFHVDGAHGASVALSPRHRDKLRGIEHADSVVWDAHKLLMMPALVTAVLFRDARTGYQAFAQEASYLFSPAAGDAGEEWWNVGLRTLECTKRMMSLELHATLRAHGVGLFRAVIERLIDAAAALAMHVEAAPDFELALTPESNIVCYRHRPVGADRMTPAELDGHQQRLRQRVIERGRYYLVTTRLARGIHLRSALMNPLVEDQDLLGLLTELRDVAAL